MTDCSRVSNQGRVQDARLGEFCVEEANEFRRGRSKREVLDHEREVEHGGMDKDLMRGGNISRNPGCLRSSAYSLECHKSVRQTTAGSQNLSK
jgi:hypothetical protein